MSSYSEIKPLFKIVEEQLFGLQSAYQRQDGITSAKYLDYFNGQLTSECKAEFDELLVRDHKMWSDSVKLGDIGRQ